MGSKVFPESSPNEIGSYQSTELTVGFEPGEGQDIFGFGFTQLEPLVELKLGVEDFSKVTPNELYRAYCIASDGIAAYRGGARTGGQLDTIEKIDMPTSTISDSFVSGTVSGYTAGCISDDGRNIYFVGVDPTLDNYMIIVSNDNGDNWVESILDASPTGIVGQTAANAEVQADIQCSKDGQNIRVAITNIQVSVEAVVYESTDFGSSFSEILTPRVALVQGVSFATDMSRDLSTVVISEITTPRFYVSVGGTGTLTNLNANLPETLTTNMRVAISDDGEKILYFNIDTAFTTFTMPFHVSEDGGVNWITYNLELQALRQVLTAHHMSARFNPDNANEIFFTVQEATTVDGSGLQGIGLYKFNINDVSSDKLGLIDNIASATIVTPAIQLTSEVKSNTNGFIYLLADPGTGRTAFYSIEAVNGKFLLDTTRQADPLKIFAGPQIQGFGFTWDRVISPVVEKYLATYISSNKVTIVSGANAGTLVRSTNSGGLFTEVTSNGFNASFGVHSIDGSDVASVIIAGGSSEVRRSTDGGANWVAVLGITGTGLIHAISCIADGTTVLAGAKDGALDVSTDSGANFSLLATPFSASANTNLRIAVIARGDDQIIFVGNEGGQIKLSLNGGTSFSDPSTPPTLAAGEKVFDMDCSSDGSKVLAIVGPKLYLSTDTGDTWSEVAVGFTHVNYRAVTVSDDGTVMMATDGDGQLIRSVNGGISFFRTVVQWKSGRNIARGLEVSGDGTVAYVMTDFFQIYKTV